MMRNFGLFRIFLNLISEDIWKFSRALLINDVHSFSKNIYNTFLYVHLFSIRIEWRVYFSQTTHSYLRVNVIYERRFGVLHFRSVRCKLEAQKMYTSSNMFYLPRTESSYFRSALQNYFRYPRIVKLNTRFGENISLISVIVAQGEAN